MVKEVLEADLVACEGSAIPGELLISMFFNARECYRGALNLRILW